MSTRSNALPKSDPHVIGNEAVGVFAPYAEIRDVEGFVRTLRRFVSEQRRAGERSADQIETMRLRAAAREAAVPWSPDATERQRGRRLALSEFNQPGNLPIARFAELADRSRQQIYKDVEAGRLLALSLGGRGLRIPDWQLDPLGRQFARSLLAAIGKDVDAWSIQRFVCAPHRALAGRTPLDSLRPGNVDELVKLAGVAFGVHV